MFYVFYNSEQRKLVGAYVNHIITRLFIILLIFLDIIFVIIGISLPDCENLLLPNTFEFLQCFNFISFFVTVYKASKDAIYALDTISLIFIIIFMVELILRIFVEM